MKRVLSLIVVLALVLSMVPAVFAAGTADAPEAITDISAGVVAELTEENNYEAYYTWTAEAAGTIQVLADTDPEVNTSTSYDIIINDEHSIYDILNVDPEAVPTYTMAVAAGDVVDILVYDEAAASVTFYVNFTPEAGTEGNPILLYAGDNTVILPAGATQYYRSTGNMNGMIATVTGENVTVAHNGVNYECNGTVTFNVVQNSTNEPALFAVTNNAAEAGVYVINFSAPVGVYDNPAELVLGENVATIAEGAQDEYYYTWTATEAGTLTIGVATDAVGWKYTIDSVTADGIYSYGDSHWSDDEEVVNPSSVAVEAGTVVKIKVTTYNPANMFSAPAGTVTVTAAFEAADGEAALPSGSEVIESYGYVDWTAPATGTVQVTFDPAEASADVLDGWTFMGTVANGDTINVEEGKVYSFYEVYQRGVNVTMNWAYVSLGEAGGEEGGEVAAVALPINTDISIECADVTYAYTAETAGTLTLSLGAAIMGPVEAKVYVEGDEANAQMLYTNSTVEVSANPGDKIIVEVTAGGYATLTTAWAVTAATMPSGSFEVPSYEAYDWEAPETGVVTVTATPSDVEVFVDQGWTAITSFTGSVELNVTAGEVYSFSDHGWGNVLSIEWKYTSMGEAGGEGGEVSAVALPVNTDVNIEPANVTYAYTAETAGILTLSLGGAVMGGVEAEVYIEGDEANAQMLYTNSTVEVSMNPGDKVIVEVTAEGYATMSTAFAVGAAEAPEGEALVIGDNSIECADVTYTYTAESAGTLNVALGSAIMGAVEAQVYIYGEEYNAQALYTNSDVNLVMEAGDVAIVAVTAEGYATLTATWSGSSEGGDEPAGDVLVLGDNEVSVAAGLAGGTWTYTAEEAGTLTVTVTELDGATEGFDMAFGFMYTLLVDENNTYSPVNAVSVEAGQTVTIQLYQAMGNAIEATINLSLGAPVEVEPNGTMSNPWIIESLPVDLAVSLNADNNYDVYYQYTVTEDGTINATCADSGCVVSAWKNGIMDSFPMEVVAGDVIMVNPWDMYWVGGEFIVTVAYSDGEEEPTEPDGTMSNPWIIESLPVDLTVSLTADNNFDVYYKYVAEKAGTINATYSDLLVSVTVNGEYSSWPITVAEGDEVIINPWSGEGDYTVSLAYAEEGGDAGEGTVLLEGENQYVTTYSSNEVIALEWTAPENGKLTIEMGEANPGWFFAVDGLTLKVTGTAAKTYEYNVIGGTTYYIRIGAYDKAGWQDGDGNITYKVSFAPAAIEIPKEPYIITDQVLTTEGTHNVVMEENAEMTIVPFTPTETGYYTISIDGGDTIGYYGAGSWFIYDSASVEHAASIEWLCEEVAGTETIEIMDENWQWITITQEVEGQTCMIGVITERESVNITIEKTGEYTPNVVELQKYVNKATLSPFSVPAGAVIGDYVNVTSETVHTAVLGADGYYHLDSADGDILLVDMDYLFRLSSALEGGRGVMYAYILDENGNIAEKWDIGDAVCAYESVTDGNKYYPLTEDLMFFYQDYAKSNGVYQFAFGGGVNEETGEETVAVDYNEECVWMYACLTMNVDNVYVAKIGDTTYKTVKEALNAASEQATAEAPVTVVLAGNANEPKANLIIDENVTLDLAGYSLTAKSLLGLNGSYITGTRYGNPGHAKIFVEPGRLALSPEALANGKNKVITYWDPIEGCYVLANTRIKDVDNALVIDEEAKTIFFRFSYGAGTAANEDFLSDGSADNGVQFVVSLAWESENGIAYQEFVYKDEYVMALANDGGNFTFELTGYDALNIDLNNFYIYAYVVTETGQVVSGTVYSAVAE